MVNTNTSCSFPGLCSVSSSHIYIYIYNVTKIIRKMNACYPGLFVQPVPLFASYFCTPISIMMFCITLLLVIPLLLNIGPPFDRCPLASFVHVPVSPPSSIMSLYTFKSHQSRCSNVLPYVCHDCSYFSCPDLLNPLYSHHSSHHSHIWSF